MQKKIAILDSRKSDVWKKAIEVSQVTIALGHVCGTLAVRHGKIEDRLLASLKRKCSISCILLNNPCAWIAV